MSAQAMSWTMKYFLKIGAIGKFPEIIIDEIRFSDLKLSRTWRGQIFCWLTYWKWGHKIPLMLRPYPTLLTHPETWPCMLFLSPSTGSGQVLAYSFARRFIPLSGASFRRSLAETPSAASSGSPTCLWLILLLIYQPISRVHPDTLFTYVFVSRFCTCYI